MENIVKKQSMGRQKIPIKKIEKKTSLQVSFSKRRNGLFKKVAEFSEQCGPGVDAAVLVVSPGGKPFHCGTPSTEHVINRYMALNNSNDDHRHNISYEGRVTDAQEFKGDELLQLINKSIDDLDLQELEEFRDVLQAFKEKL